MKRSTVTNLTETLNVWTFALDNKQSITAAYVDFSKAFDTVCHSKLVNKLSAYGFLVTYCFGLRIFWQVEAK